MRLSIVVIAACTITAPAAAQDYHFTRTLGAGDRMEISNISGNMEISRASGRVAEVSVTKTVKKGDGSMVKAIMEEGGRDMVVCTVYVNREPNRRTCNGDNNNDGHGRDNFEVDMHYVVRVPAGARLTVDDVNGNVTVTGGDADARINTVNGDIRYDGVGASELETVNGKIVATFTSAGWEGSMSVQTVNGLVDLTFPAGLSADVSGETVNGSISSDFPITIEKGWGPKSFNGRIGGGGRRLKIETVNGGIALRKR